MKLFISSADMSSVPRDKIVGVCERQDGTMRPMTRREYDELMCEDAIWPTPADWLDWAFGKRLPDGTLLPKEKRPGRS